MRSVHDLLQEKAAAIHTVAPNATVYEALLRMADANVGALLVLESAQLMGIFSERDYARKLVLKGKFSKDTLVRYVMTTELVTVGPRESVEACMALMTQRRVRHLPVIDDGRAIGVVSIGDVVRSIISDQRSTIDQLEDYICGSQRASSPPEAFLP